MNDSKRHEPSDEELKAAIPKQRGGREVRVGVFVILGMVSLIAVWALLTDPATLRGRYMLYTVVEDAGGIRRGDPVQMRGVNIGSINRFGLLDDGRVAIRMEIDGEWSIPADSRTRLEGGGLTGGRTMNLIPGTATAVAQAGDTIVGEDVGGGDLFATASEVGEQASGVLDRLQDMLDQPTVESVRSTAGELEALVAELRAIAAEQRDELSALTASLRRSAEGLETAAGAGPDVASAAARADSALVRVEGTVRTLDDAATTLRSILARVDAGEGTLGRLLTDASLYDNLNRAAEGAAELLADLRANPSRYIRLSIF